MADKDKQLTEFSIQVEREKSKRKSSDTSFGIEVNGTPVRVEKIHSSSCFLGKLFVGDIIISVNGQKTNTPDDFMKIIRAETKMEIRLKRDDFCTFKVNSLPSGKQGINCFEVDLVWRTGGVPIGILICEDEQKRVVVSMVSSGTLACENIKPGDMLIKVNDVLVPDKAKAKKMIRESLDRDKRVKLTMERAEQVVQSLISARHPPISIAPVSATPTSVTSTSTVSTVLNFKTSPAASNITEICPIPPAMGKSLNSDLTLPPDVLAIMAANRNFYKSLNKNPPILRRSTAKTLSDSISSDEGAAPTKTTSRTSLTTQHEETKIECDTLGRQLQITPKRIGS